MLFDQKLAVIMAKSCNLLTILCNYLPIDGKKLGFKGKLSVRRRTSSGKIKSCPPPQAQTDFQTIR